LKITIYNVHLSVRITIELAKVPDFAITSSTFPPFLWLHVVNASNQQMGTTKTRTKLN